MCCGHEEANRNDVDSDETVEQPMEVVEFDTSEEYLEEEVLQESVNFRVNEDTNDFDRTQVNIMEDTESCTTEMKLEPNSCHGDIKPYVCFYCERAFLSRSGRDTHQQMTHKIPEGN